MNCFETTSWVFFKTRLVYRIGSLQVLSVFISVSVRFQDRSRIVHRTRIFSSKIPKNGKQRPFLRGCLLRSTNQITSIWNSNFECVSKSWNKSEKSKQLELALLRQTIFNLIQDCSYFRTAIIQLAPAFNFLASAAFVFSKHSSARHFFYISSLGGGYNSIFSKFFPNCKYLCFFVLLQGASCPLFPTLSRHQWH